MCCLAASLSRKEGWLCAVHDYFQMKMLLQAGMAALTFDCRLLRAYYILSKLVAMCMQVQAAFPLQS